MRIGRLVPWAVLIGACASGGGGGGGAVVTPSSTPARITIQTRLEEKLRFDPNRELCERLAADFRSGNRDAMLPIFDHRGFVERVIAQGNLPPDVQAQLRGNPTAYAEFARFHSAPGSSFLCLGTRQLFGQDHLALRVWTPSRFDYALFHVGSDPTRPLDDFMVVSQGSYHSEANAWGFTPELQAPMQIVSQMLQMSYENRFPEIIAAFRTLPASLQSSPVAFLHFVNSVFTIEPVGSPLYQEAVTRMEVVLADRTYSLAYWRFQDAVGRGDRPALDRSRGTLLELLDDYELLTR